MENMNIESAQYVILPFDDGTIIKSVVNGETLFVPIDPANTEYAEIMRQVEDGSLVISPAEGEE